MKARGRCPRCAHDRIVDLATLIVVEHPAPNTNGEQVCKGSGGQAVMLKVAEINVLSKDDLSALETLAMTLWKQQETA